MAVKSKWDPALKKQRQKLNQRVNSDASRDQLQWMLELLPMKAVVAWTGIPYRTLDGIKRSRYDAITFKYAILIENLYERLQQLGAEMEELRTPILKF